MTTEQFIAHLRAQDIRLWKEGETLRVSAEPGVVTSELRDELQRRKVELLAWLRRAKDTKRVESVALKPEPRRGRSLPLSFAQQRLWFLDKLFPGSANYNLQVALRLRGPLNRAALQQTLDQLIVRHESLRTIFRSDNDQPVQVVQAPSSCPIETFDLRHLPPAGRERRATEIVAQRETSSFDLSQGPLLRVGLMELQEQDHVLVLTKHHIITDAWSFSLMGQQFSTLYQAFCRQQPSPLKELKIQYADYAVWQHRWMSGQVLEKQLGYWKRQLQNHSTLELPTDVPRPRNRSSAAAEQRLRLPKQLVTQIKAVGQQQGATLFMTMLAVFKVLLHRYSGQEDLVIGTPIANRNRVETEGVIGFFINSLVLRTDAAGDPGFREFLKRVRETAMEAFEHQDLPFEKLVEELQPERDLSRNPLFQVLFQVQNAPEEKWNLGEIDATEMEEGVSITSSDLEIDIWEHDDHLAVVMCYAKDLFHESTIQRMLVHYHRLLESVVADPDQPISQLSMLSDEERQLLLGAWSESPGDYSLQQPVHQLIQQQVQNNPQATALLCGDQPLSYQQLDQRANQLAHYLIQQGLQPEQLVGLLMDPSIEMVVAILATLKAGGAYVPLDPKTPPERLEFLLQDTQATVLLTQSAYQQKLTAFAGHILCLDGQLPQQLDNQPDTNPDRPVGPDNLAYVIYTSGSTGKPKGVLIEHEGICNHIQWMDQQFPLKPSDCVLQLTRSTFDVSVWEILGSLAGGARLLIPPADANLDPASLVNMIQQHRVTILQLVPTLLRMLMSQPGFDQCDSLREVFCGGEAMPVELANEFLQRMDCRLNNMYGPTETSIDATYYRCTQPIETTTVPIGRPVANKCVYVLDQHNNLAPIGVAGELYVGGIGTARQYLNQPQLTQEKFVADPFATDSQARLYRTGDLCRWLPRGELDFLGRTDQQVKIRGFRIELGEIEGRLDAHPGIQQAVVVARTYPAGQQRLVAYLVAEDPPKISSLQEFLREDLPDYMVPAAYCFLPSLPLLASGKVDQQALPEPDQLRPQLEVEFQGPRSAEEKMIAGIWQQLLHLDRVGIDDSFFEIGGNSLLLVQMQRNLQSQLNTDIAITELFRHPTIRTLAQFLRSNQQDTPAERPDLKREAKRQEMLSRQQARSRPQRNPDAAN